MFIISKKQMQVLDADARRRFHIDLMAWLRRHAPRGKRMDDATLLSLIERQEEHAAQYGLCTKQEIAKWCYLVLITREEFDSLSPISDMLRDPLSGSRPGERLEKLIHQLAHSVDRVRTNRRRFQ